MTPGGRAAEPGGVVAPTRVDPFARSMSEVIGGPLGRRARPHRWWLPVRVMLALFAGVFALAIVQHQPCLKTNWANDQARYGKACYSDVPYMYTGRGLAEGLWPYADSHGRYPVLEYPVGISYLAWTAAKITQLHPSGPPVSERHHQDPDVMWSLPGMTTEVNTYFLVTALVLCGFGLLATWFLAGVDPRRPWDALPFVLSPALLMTGLINWDLMAVALVAGTLWAWARDRPVLTGVLIGLGTAVKLYPLFLLGPVLVIAWRRRRPYDALLALAGAAGAWALANLPAWLSGPEQWRVFWRFNSERGADLGSVWLALTHHGHTFSAHTINLWSWLLFGAVCVLVAVLGLRAPRTPRLAQLGFLVVAGFLLVNKVYSPHPAGATCSSGRRVSSSTSQPCGPTSAAGSRRPSAAAHRSTTSPSGSASPPNSTSSPSSSATSSAPTTTPSSPTPPAPRPGPPCRPQFVERGVLVAPNALRGVFLSPPAR
jgi:uncharacterized membrane protein